MTEVKFKISAIFNNSVCYAGWTYFVSEEEAKNLAKIGWADIVVKEKTLDIKEDKQVKNVAEDITQKITNKEQSFNNNPKNRKK